ncbi:MAG: hypothetical protein AB7N71_12145 [Phycisphaerae bacterium]
MKMKNHNCSAPIRISRAKRGAETFGFRHDAQIAIGVLACALLLTGCQSMEKRTAKADGPCVLDKNAVNKTLADFGDGEAIFDYETLRIWWDNPQDHSQIQTTALSTGTARNGKYNYLAHGTGLGSQYFYFDAKSGDFVAFRSITDIVDATCKDGYYWPRVIDASDHEMSAESY